MIVFHIEPFQCGKVCSQTWRNLAGNEIFEGVEGDEFFCVANGRWNLARNLVAVDVYSGKRLVISTETVRSSLVDFLERVVWTYLVRNNWPIRVAPGV